LSLANRIISLSGKIPNVDIKVELTGLRAGEKMHEQLYYDVEQLKHTSHKKIFHISSAIKHIENYELLLNTAIKQAINFQDDELTKSIKKLVPEFVHQTLKIVEKKSLL